MEITKRFEQLRVHLPLAGWGGALAWGLRLAALAGGVAAMAAALWIFYARPWFGVVSRYDEWLDGKRCLVDMACSLPHHVGVLSLLAALLLLGLAFAGRPMVWAAGDDHLQPPGEAWQFGRLRRLVMLLALAGCAVLAVQVYTIAVLGTAPAVWLWLLGLGAFAAAAACWDLLDSNRLLRTLANLLVAVAIAALVLAAAQLWAGRLVAIPVGLAAFCLLAAASWWTTRLGSSFRPVDHGLMLAVALLALGLGMVRAWSWRYAFIGDEWGFYETARTLIHRPEVFHLLGLRDPNDYHTVLSSALQAWAMQLAGEDVWGWRLSSVLPAALSAPALYALIHWLAGRPAATLGAVFFAAAHVLLTFAMVAYNNTQALLPLALALGFWALAVRSNSALRYLLIGAALGLGFFVYGLARLAVIPLGVLLLIHGWPSLRRMAFYGGWMAAGGVAVAAPMLFNVRNWLSMLRATPLQSEVAEDGIGVGAQLLNNASNGFFAFLNSSHNTHFVAGPHLEPLTALFLVAGLAICLVSATTHRRALGWLLAGGLFWIAVSMIQQYGHVSTTRMFILPVVYCGFAGVGAAAIVRLLFPNHAMLRSGLLGVLATAVVVLNQIHIVRISHANSYWHPQALMVQQLQETGALDGGGMPTFLVMETATPWMEAMIAHAYNIGRERLIFLSDVEALALPHLCNAGGRPAMALVHARNPQAAAVRAHIAGCWPGAVETEVLNNYGEVWLYRLLTPAGQEQVGRPASARHSSRPRPDLLSAHRPGDIAVAGDGTIHVLSREAKEVYSFSPDGRLLNTIVLQQPDPSAMAVTANGLILVTSTGGDHKLVWYSRQGEILLESAPDQDLGAPRDVAITDKGEIYLADVEYSRIVQLSPMGDVMAYLTGGGLVHRPGSLAVGGDGSIWVVNSGTQQLLQIAPDDRLLAEIPIQAGIPELAPRLVIGPDGNPILSQPEERRVLWLNRQGELLRIWSGFHYPVGLALDAFGRLYVADYYQDEVAILPSIDQ